MDQSCGILDCDCSYYIFPFYEEEDKSVVEYFNHNVQSLISTPTSSRRSSISSSTSSYLIVDLPTATASNAEAVEVHNSVFVDTVDLGSRILTLEEDEDLDIAEKAIQMKALLEMWARAYPRVKSLVEAGTVGFGLRVTALDA